FEKSDMIWKVKEPEPCEYKFLRENQILFTYLHLAPNPGLTKALMDKKLRVWLLKLLWIKPEICLACVL
ncbi:MAG: hypothetical protein J6V02_01730, partial [Bacteroidaceae bacterium]|nr:hypothetical protein [Bacteroidaceae bacterium]